MAFTHRVTYSISVFALVAGLGAALLASTKDDGQPSSGQIASAQKVSDLMVNELVAALFQEFNETTPANAEQGKQAISLIFNDHNRDMRLIGSFGPLQGGENDHPSGSFETTALSRALTGQPYTEVQKINDTWYYRRSVPLSNTFHTACVVCHSNFTPEFFANSHNPGQWVGSLVLAVPIKAADEDQK